MESPTQTIPTAALQQKTGELWGAPAVGSNIPKVKAYDGRLPTVLRGIEFSTEVEPDEGSPPGKVFWSGPRAGVVVENGHAKIKIVILKNTQK